MATSMADQVLRAVHRAELALHKLPPREVDAPDLNPALARLRAWRAEPTSRSSAPIGAICAIDGDPLRESVPALRALLEAIDKELFGPMGARKGAPPPHCLFHTDGRRAPAVDPGQAWRAGRGAVLDGVSPLWEERAREQQLAEYAAMCGVPTLEVKALVETHRVCCLGIWGKAEGSTVAGRQLDRLVSSGWYRLAAAIWFGSKRQHPGAPKATLGTTFMPPEHRAREIATCAKLLRASADIVSPAVSILGMYAIGIWAGANSHRGAGHELLRSADLLLRQVSFFGAPNPAGGPSCEPPPADNPRDHNC